MIHILLWLLTQIKAERTGGAFLGHASKGGNLSVWEFWFEGTKKPDHTRHKKQSIGFYLELKNLKNQTKR